MDDAQAVDAVHARLAEIYPGQHPRHWDTVYRYSDGGSAPLDSIRAFAADSPPHWHYVSTGMSKWGFEFSFRLVRRKEVEPPVWPIPFLQQLGRYVHNSGQPLVQGQSVRWGGPITDVQRTALVALVFALDPLLQSVQVGDERLQFIVPLGITAAEYDVCAQSSSDLLLAELLADNPLGIVDLRRS